MTPQDTSLTPATTIAELASTLAGATRVFHRRGIDFCCSGHVRLDEACAAAGLEPEALLEEIRAEATEHASFERWDERPVPELIEHILRRFHDGHRAEVPRLLAMARKVDEVHAEREDRPQGLVQHLERMAEELEMHMQKEEQVLFPILREGQGFMAAAPIQVMEHEHRDHGANLAHLRALTNDFTPPADACATWSGLYLGLAELEREIHEHIHTENNILFPRALREGA